MNFQDYQIQISIHGAIWSIPHEGAVLTHTAFVQVALDFVLVYTAVFCPKRTLCFVNSSLFSRRLKVMGARKNGVGPVLSCYFFLIISKHLLCRLYKQEICEKKAPDFNKSKNKILLL